MLRTPALPVAAYVAATLLGGAACGSSSEGDVVQDSLVVDTEAVDDVDDPDILDTVPTPDTDEGIDTADIVEAGEVRPPACGSRECGYLPDGTRCGGCWLAKDGLISTSATNRRGRARPRPS